MDTDFAPAIAEQLKDHASCGSSTIDDFEIVEFDQLWPNSGGAFAKPGYVYCDAMTMSRTTVLMPRTADEPYAIVFFDGKYGYRVPTKSQSFQFDLEKKLLLPVSEHDVYWKLSQPLI